MTRDAMSDVESEGGADAILPPSGSVDGSTKLVGCIFATVARDEAVFVICRRVRSSVRLSVCVVRSRHVLCEQFTQYMALFRAQFVPQIVCHFSSLIELRVL
jgi:hypothetical protein